MRLLITFLRLPAMPPPAAAPGALSTAAGAAGAAASGICICSPGASCCASWTCCIAGRAGMPLVLPGPVRLVGGRAGCMGAAGGAAPSGMSAAAAASADRLVNRSASSGPLHGRRAHQNQMLAAAEQKVLHVYRPQDAILSTSRSRTVVAPHMLLLVCSASCVACSAAANAPATSGVCVGSEGGAPGAGAASPPDAAGCAGDADSPACARGAAAGGTARCAALR